MPSFFIRKKELMKEEQGSTLREAQMICTVTLNPALDYTLDVKDFRLGRTNRTLGEEILPGGKGINVSLVLRNLGFESRVLGFTAGFTGGELERLLRERGLKTDFIRLSSGMTRINVKLRSMEGTELNARGPEIGPESLELFLERIGELSSGDVLVLAGSVPKSLPGSIYEDIMGRLSGKGVRILVDAEGEALKGVLPLRPFLVKPNIHELGGLFGRELSGPEEVPFYGKKLQEAGAENVLVSMAGQGAVFLSAEGHVYRSPAPKGELINGVGAGDSMVAGFLAGWLESGDYETAFSMGLAAGSASAFSEGLAEKKEVQRLLQEIRPRRLE